MTTGGSKAAPGGSMALFRSALGSGPYEAKSESQRRANCGRCRARLARLPARSIFGSDGRASPDQVSYGRTGNSLRQER